MSDYQKAHVALALALNACDTVLPQLSAPPIPSHTPLALVRNDFLSLLSLIHASATKIALALKPASPTYSAALTPANDTARHIRAIAHCVSLIQPHHGTTLRNEYKAIAQDLITATQSLLRSFMPKSSPGPPSDEYLAKTGAVHAVVDNARQPDALSPHNPAAVCKVWKKDHAVLIDALQELEETLEDENLDQGEDDFDDGWDELGIESNQALTPDERKKGEKLLQILRLSNLIHQRVSDNVLASLPADPPATKEANLVLDTLVSHSSALLSATDELVGTAYSPSPELEKELISFQNLSNSIKSDLDRLQSHLPLDQQLQKLQLPGKSQDPFNELQQNIDSLLTSIRSSP